MNSHGQSEEGALSRRLRDFFGSGRKLLIRSVSCGNKSGGVVQLVRTLPVTQEAGGASPLAPDSISEPGSLRLPIGAALAVLCPCSTGTSKYDSAHGGCGVVRRR